MAASILANEMGLDLYRIELSQVVSKYIGETEKNLSKIFEAAEGSGVILFFDEADAIFGKRSETKDAHDRYANIEVSYLLQKIEEYNGLVILASNFKQNIDEAFIRRMRFIINFPFPDKEMREKIWQKVFPKNTPIEKDIDFSLLAQNFALSGANIRNIALFSAFFAAEQEEEIQMKQIIDALKIELTKIGKTFKSKDFTSFV
jgi:SpoVK/Ycf46/Vps4 family AAA+-type ATPase